MLGRLPPSQQQLQEQQIQARKRRKARVDRERVQRQRAEYLQLKAEKQKQSKGGSGPRQKDCSINENNGQGGPLFPGLSREPLLERATQAVERVLRAHGVQPEQVAPPALYAGCKGKDDTCKLAAALIEQGWVDPRNVVVWGVALIEWRDWGREKVGADWVVDDGLMHDDIDITCAPLNIVSPAVMWWYEQGKKRFEVRAGAASAPTRASRRSAASAARGIKMYLRCKAGQYKGFLLELQVERVLRG